MTNFDIYTIYNSGNSPLKTIIGTTNLTIESPTFLISLPFLSSKLKFILKYNYIGDENTQSIDDVKSITLTYTHSQPNENKKNNTNNVIKMRIEEINELRKEREEINVKIEDNDFSDEELKDLHEEIDDINDKIKNHKKEIKILNLKLDVEQDEVSKYVITLFRNNITHISGLPGQTTNFSLCWFSKKDTEKIIKPISII